MRTASPIVRVTLSLVFLLLSLSAIAGGERLPIGEFTAVRLDPPPTVDGTMAPGEWDRAFASSGLIAPFDHALQNAETTMYMGYDATRFYFCIRCRRSAGEWKLWKLSRTNDDYNFGEPSVEIWVTPPTLVPETYQNILNTYPAVFDQKFIPTRGYASLGWKANWTLGESEDDAYYTIEASVPVKDFGFDAVKNGDTWRFLLCRNALGARPRSQASWSITQGFSEIPQHPQVHFADKAPVVQLLSVISVFTGTYHFPLAVAAPKDAPAEVDVTLRFQAGMQPAEADVVTKKTVTLKAGERQEIAFDGTVPDGWKKGFFHIIAVSRDGKTLFDQSFPFEVTGFTPEIPVKPEKAKPVEPLVLTAMYGPQTDWLQVKADIFDCPRRDEVTGGTVKIIDDAGNRVLATCDIDVFSKYYSTTRLSLAKVNIPVKDYSRIAYQKTQIENIKKENENLAKQGKPQKPVPELKDIAPLTVRVECALRDKTGAEVAKNSTTVPLMRLVMPWMNNTIGITDKVIPPWTPVQVAGNTLSVWNRRMTVDGLGLTQNLDNGGTRQLATGMRLVATIDGKAVPVAAGAPTITRQVDAAVDFTGTGKAPGLNLSAATRMEFDGCTVVTLTVAPDAKTAKVDGLTLEITLPESEATHFCTTAGGWAAVHADTPASWTSLQTASGTLVNDFVPYIWLTNSERGFLWFADSDKGWITDGDRTHATQEFVRKDGVLTLRVHFIEVPTELTAPTTLTFGYQAFPSRPLPSGWRAIFCANGPPAPDTTNTYFWTDADWAVLWPYYCSPFPWSMDKSRALLSHVPVDSTHRPCVGSIAHSIGRYLDYDRNDFSALATDWGATPGQIGNADVTQSRGPIDFRVFHYQRWVREARFRGLYIDENYLSTEDNWLTGNAYFRADGRLQQGYSYLGLREYYKRMMTMFHQNNVPRPNLWMHITSGSAYHAWFGDVFYEGENVEPTDLNFDYIEVLPAGRLRSIGSAVCSGGVMTMMCQALRHQTVHVEKHIHQFVGWVMAHDIVPEQVPYYPLLTQEGRLYEPSVTFLPYWKPTTPIRTATPECMVSAHQTAGRALLWVVNTARKDQDVAVAIDFAKLGLNGKRTVAVNVETGARIALTDKGFTVPVLQRDYVPVMLVERKQLGDNETLVASFDTGTRADEAIGSNAFSYLQYTPGATLACRSGVNGAALDASRGVSFTSHLHLMNAEGRIRFQGLVREGAAGTLLQLGPLAVTCTTGRTPVLALEWKEKEAPLKVEAAALTAGWHAFDLAWKGGKANLTVDGKAVGTVTIGTLGITERFTGTGNRNLFTEGQVKLGDNRGGLLAIDDLRCSLDSGL
jgi:hypothetical protein